MMELMNCISPVQKAKLERMLPNLSVSQTTLDEF
jgi:hypothetical protein